ncbi:stalk domain-containing protein [Paenibacillus sp. Z6-24]
MFKNKFLRNSIMLLAGILVLSALSQPVTASAAAPPRQVKLEWNGTRLPENGLLINGNTMIPVVLLRDSLGVTLRYEPAVKTYTLLQNDDQLDMIMTASGVTMRLNNHRWNGPSAKVVNGRMYIPFTVLRDGFGYQSSWNAVQLKLNFAKKGAFFE